MKFRNGVLKNIRKQQRWTARSLAMKLGVTSTTLHMWESGHHLPSVEKIAAIAEVLNIQTKELIEHDDTNTDTAISTEHNANIGNLLKTISAYEKSKLEESVNSLSKNARYLSEKIKELSIIFNAIMQANPAFCYIKDVSQNYVMASQVFLDILGLDPSYDVRGKRDNNFYSASESLENHKEDDEVLATGMAVKYKERDIPGTRKSRFAIVFKIPIIGVNSKPIGLMGTFLDITEKRKAEQMVEILKKAMETMDEVIWIAKSPIETKDGSIDFEEILYAINSNFRKVLLKKVEHLPYQEQVKYFYKEMITEKNMQKHSFKNIMKNKKSQIFYHIKHPGENRIISIVDKIYYIPEMHIFIGLIQENFDKNA